MVRAFARRHGVGLVVAFAPLAAGVFSYTSATNFYDGFGISPSEAGLTVEQLVGSAIALAVLAGLVVGCASIGKTIPKQRVAALVTTGLIWWLTFAGTRRDPALTPTGVWLSYSLFLFVGLRYLYRSRRSGRHRWPRLRWCLQWLILPLVAGVMLTLTGGVALDRFWSSGTATSTTALPAGFGPRVRFVKVVTHAPGFESVPGIGGLLQASESGCILSLGDGPAGRVLLVTSTEGGDPYVMFVNSQQVSLVAAPRCAMRRIDLR